MRLTHKILISFLFSLIIFSAYGQNQPVKVEISKEKIKKEGVNFYLHKVEKGETIFSICKAYEITPEILLEDNPLLVHGLKEGSTILVRDLSKKVSFIKHTVRWYDSLSSIAKKYGVSETDIIQVNSLKDDRLSVRQVLLIPDSSSISNPLSDDNIMQTDVTSDEKVATSINYDQKEILTEKHVSANRHFADFRFNVSLILPLGSNKTEISEMDANFLDFYEGFLLAVNDMKEEGMNINLKVLDMYDFPSGQILAQSGKLDNSHLIVGPVFEKEIAQIVSHTEREGIPLVSPMDSKTESLVSDHPFFYQINTNLYNIQMTLLKSIPKGSHVTIIYEDSGEDRELIELTKRILSELGLTYNSISYNILSGRGVTSKIGDKLSPTSMNAVVVPSNQEAFVSDVLRNLNLLQTINKFNITLYGTSKWRSFDNIDINYCHSMNLHIALQHFVDYNDPNVKKFLLRYRALYNCEPNPYSFQAYDIAKYFLGQLLKEGPDFYKLQNHSTQRLLQSDFKFERPDSDSGYINTATRLVIYNPDYSVNIGSLGL